MLVSSRFLLLIVFLHIHYKEFCKMSKYLTRYGNCNTKKECDFVLQYNVTIHQNFEENDKH